MGVLIDTVRIAGFRGIQNAEISLPGVAVLIGTNNSGKTSIIKWQERSGGLRSG